MEKITKEQFEEMPGVKLADVLFEVILIKDKETGGYTSFFKDFPGAVGQGDSEEQAIESATNALYVLLSA